MTECLQRKRIQKRRASKRYTSSWLRISARKSSWSRTSCSTQPLSSRTSFLSNLTHASRLLSSQISTKLRLKQTRLGTNRLLTSLSPQNKKKWRRRQGKSSSTSHLWMTWRKLCKTCTRSVISCGTLDFLHGKVSKWNRSSSRISRVTIEIREVYLAWLRSGTSTRFARHSTEMYSSNPVIRDQILQQTCHDPPQRWLNKLLSRPRTRAKSLKKQCSMRNATMMPKQVLLHNSNKPYRNRKQAFLSKR